MRAELEQVYQQHRQTLFSLALTVTGCSGIAEDAVHEAFMRLCQLKVQPSGSLTAYVFAAVRNAAIDCRRRQQRQTALAESLFLDSGKDAGAVSFAAESSGPEVSERNAQLKSAIDQLDELTRQVLVMKIFAEMTFDEIGEVLETPSATVATRYRRAILKLEEQLRKNS